MKIGPFEIIFRRAPKPPTPEEEEAAMWDAYQILWWNMVGGHPCYEGNFFGFRPKVTVTPWVAEPTLLIPSDRARQFENYVKRRFGGPMAQVWGQTPIPVLRKPEEMVVKDLPPLYDYNPEVIESSMPVADAEDISLGSKQ